MLLRQRYSALLGGHSMIKITSLPTIAGVLLALGLSAAPAQAGPNRTFVSGTGTDSGACSRTAPCRTFAFALTQTNAGGEIDVLDPAGYGTVLITKAISIVNDGAGTAGITAAGSAISIFAGTSDSVHLRGLTIQGLGGPALSGIEFDGGGNLAIENCVIWVHITPSTSSSFSVSNTVASNNGQQGILVGPSGTGVVTGVLSKVTANNNSVGIGVDGRFFFSTAASINVTVVDSEASNNSAFGVFAHSHSGSAATAVMLRNVVASNNSTGLEAKKNAILRVAHSVVTGNGTGVETLTGGTIFSYGDNDIDGNTNNNTAVLTSLAMH
jgi:hypothetical protein